MQTLTLGQRVAREQAIINTKHKLHILFLEQSRKQHVPIKHHIQNRRIQNGNSWGGIAETGSLFHCRVINNITGR